MLSNRSYIMAKQVIKVGDLVRVPRRNLHIWHHLAFGCVAEVLSIDASDGTYSVQGWCHDVGGVLGQWVGQSGVRLAKQAMRKRDAYAQRRG